MARQHRWRFQTLDPLKDILLYAHKSGRPRVEIDRAQLHHGQDVIYFPGKQKWLPIDITFYHVVENVDAASKIYEWWSTNVISITQSRVNINKVNCVLQLLDANGSNIYEYTMHGCWPSKVTPDELDYASTKISEITFTLEMDKATEKAANTLSSQTPHVTNATLVGR
jgi:hypothetical protein